MSFKSIVTTVTDAVAVKCESKITEREHEL